MEDHIRLEIDRLSIRLERLEDRTPISAEDYHRMDKRVIMLEDRQLGLMQDNASAKEARTASAAILVEIKADMCEVKKSISGRLMISYMITVLSLLAMIGVTFIHSAPH